MDELWQKQIEEMMEEEIKEAEHEYEEYISSTEGILDQRQTTHGDFSKNAYTAQTLKNVMRSNGSNWKNLTFVQQEGLDMIQHKIARFLNGKTSHIDTVDDIIGYATLIKRGITHEHIREGS